MEPRLINANDLGCYTVKIDGHRYVPWVAIAEVPTVEALRHGTWKESRNISRLPVCSFCKECNMERSAYCPHCGAKMEDR